MKFSKLSALLNKRQCINIVEFESDLWLGTGAALYRIEGNIKADDAGLCSLLNIPERKRDEFAFIRNSEGALNLLQAALDNGNDVEAYNLPVNYSRNKTPLQIFATEQGAVMFDNKLIDIAKTDDTTINLSYCNCKNGGFHVLTVWDSILKAVIAPMQSFTENELINLERFLSQVKLARLNEMLMPIEEEQIKIDDYPFKEQEESIL